MSRRRGLLSAVLAAACQPQPVAESDAGQSIIAQERRALEQWAAGNPLGYLDVDANDVTYFDDIGAHSRIDGKDAMRAHFTSLQGEIPPHRYELLDPRVQLYGDIGILTLRYRAYPSDGKPAAHLEGDPRAIFFSPSERFLPSEVLPMAASVQEELTRMRIILQDLEGRLEAGEVPPEELPEFKSTVDEIRLRVWALLTAAGAEAPREAAERFRLRRAAEFCRALTNELSTGHLGAGHPEWIEVQQTVTNLGAAIREHTGRAA